MGRPEKRTRERFKKRVSCELLFEERRYSGIVIDVSPRGLFVQTSAKPKLGRRVMVLLRVPGVGTCEIATRVARLKMVPPQLLSVVNGGVGLFVEMPTPEFDRLIAEVSGTSGD